MISILMATRNRAGILRQVLDHYERLEAPRGGWKAIVVDNGSTDETRDLVDSYASRLPIEYVYEGNAGKSAALNAGFSRIAGDLLLFTDDDILPPPNWLVRYEQEAAARPEYDVFGGAIVCKWPSEPPQWMIADERIAMACFAYTDPAMVTGPVEHTLLYGGNFAIRTSVLPRSPLFNTAVGPKARGSYAMGNETDLLRRMAAQGCRSWFIDGIAVGHVVRPEQMTQAWMLRRAVNSGRGVYRIVSQEPQPTFLRYPRAALSGLVRNAAAFVRASIRRDVRTSFASRWYAHYWYGHLKQSAVSRRGAPDVKANSSPASPATVESTIDQSPPAGSATSAGLGARTTSGAAWSVIARVANQVMSIGSTAVLARVIPPTDYGVVGMSMVYIGFIAIFRDLGLSFAVIREARLDHSWLSTVFWANCALAVISTAAVVITAPWVAEYFHEPLLRGVVIGMSLSFPLSAAGTVHSSLLNRDLRFRTLAGIEIFSASVAFVTSVIMALAGYRVWALVAGAVVSPVISSVMLWRAVTWVPSFIVRADHLRSIVSFSLNLTGFNIVNYFARSLDSVIIGRYLGAAPLAHYRLAYGLMLYPVQNISQVFGRALFPAFSTMQHDDARFRSAYLRTCGALAVIAFPLAVLLASLPDLIIRVVYGPNWAPAGTLLAILAPVGIMQSIATTVGHIYTAKGRTDWLFRWGIVASLLTACSFIVGLRWGAVGVASAYAVAMMLLTYPCFAFPFRLIGLRVADLFRVLRPMGIAALVMFAVAVGSRKLVTDAGVNAPFALLSISASFAALAYATTIWFLHPPAIEDLLGFSNGMLTRVTTWNVFDRFRNYKTMRSAGGGAC